MSFPPETGFWWLGCLSLPYFRNGITLHRLSLGFSAIWLPSSLESVSSTETHHLTVPVCAYRIILQTWSNRLVSPLLISWLSSVWMLTIHSSPKEHLAALSPCFGCSVLLSHAVLRIQVKIPTPTLPAVIHSPISSYGQGQALLSNSGWLLKSQTAH